MAGLLPTFIELSREEQVSCAHQVGNFRSAGDAGRRKRHASIAETETTAHVVGVEIGRTFERVRMMVADVSVERGPGWRRPVPRRGPTPPDGSTVVPHAPLNLGSVFLARYLFISFHFVTPNRATIQIQLLE